MRRCTVREDVCGAKGRGQLEQHRTARAMQVIATHERRGRNGEVLFTGSAPQSEPGVPSNDLLNPSNPHEWNL